MPANDHNTLLSKLAAASLNAHAEMALKASLIDSPLGPLVAIGDKSVLYLLEFIDCRGLDQETGRLLARLNASLTAGSSEPLRSIERELELYFKGKLKQFDTPIALQGTEFQKTVWQELMKIPYGMTRSYAEIAQALGKKTAFRAVANANGSNQLAIIIPCHRVINTGGGLGGYSGGVLKKKWLLSHEKTTAFN